MTVPAFAGIDPRHHVNEETVDFIFAVTAGVPEDMSYCVLREALGCFFPLAVINAENIIAMELFNRLQVFQNLQSLTNFTQVHYMFLDRIRI
jgi:hypothetical protein